VKTDVTCLKVEDLGIYKDLEIDIYQLEKEWLKQAVIFMEYMEKTIKMENEKGVFKDKIIKLRAELDLKIRNEFAQRGVKVTEKLLESSLNSEEEVVCHNECYNTVNYNYNLLNACIKALDYKKAALENLVKLHLGGYFSEPSLRNKKGEEVSENIRSKLNKNIKKLNKNIK